MVCGNGATVSSSAKIPCTEEHNWRAVTTIKLGEPGEEYPGDRLVEVKSRDFCSDSVGAWLNYPIDYDFGWTYFHEAEWEAGNRRSVCWAKTDQMTRLAAPSLLAVVLAGLLAGCTRLRRPRRSRRRPAGPPSSPTATPTPAEAVPRPENGACYRLDVRRGGGADHQAQAPRLRRRAHRRPRSRSAPSTPSPTGTCSPSTPGQVQDRVATECPRRFDDFVGGTVEERRLSMLRAVWFTPTVGSPTAAPTGTAAT